MTVQKKKKNSTNILFQEYPKNPRQMGTSHGLSQPTQVPRTSSTLCKLLGKPDLNETSQSSAIQQFIWQESNSLALFSVFTAQKKIYYFWAPAQKQVGSKCLEMRKGKKKKAKKIFFFSMTKDAKCKHDLFSDL